MKHLKAVIMAGGSVTRFWPVDREGRPKQMINIIGEGSMLIQSISRLDGVVKDNDIYIVTMDTQLSDIRTRIGGKGLSRISVLTEPCPRNTAPAIGLVPDCLTTRPQVGEPHILTV